MEITDEIRNLLDPDLTDRILSGNASTPTDEARRDRQLDLMEELAAAYRSCFSSPAGARVLEHLESITVRESCFVPGISFQGADGLSAEQNGFMREGQNSVVREIRRYMVWTRPQGDSA